MRWMGPAKELTALGIEFSSEKRGFLPTAKRHWQLRQAIRWLLERNRVSGEQLEVIMGHFAFFCMLNRKALSIFHTVYKHIRSKHKTYSRLRLTCKDELSTFLGVMPLVRSGWRIVWSM